jgi:hypothetical protein
MIWNGFLLVIGICAAFLAIRFDHVSVPGWCLAPVRLVNYGDAILAICAGIGEAIPGNGSAERFSR